VNDSQRDELLIRIDERVSKLQSAQADWYSLCSDHRDRCRAEVDERLDKHGTRLDDVAGKILSWRTTALVLGAVVLTIGAQHAPSVVAILRSVVP
jgi:hypothetical protein